MLRYWPERERQIPFPIEYEPPDIICSLPEDVCRRVLATYGLEFPGWNRLIDLWRERSNTRDSFKRFAFKELGIRWSSGTFIERILEEAPRNMRSDRALDRAIAAAIAIATPQPPDLTAGQRAAPRGWKLPR